MVVMAALAAQQRRAALLPQVLASLRPQVDRLCVYLNGWDGVPACVREFADEYILDPANTGAERKFHWCDAWDGLYFTADDDILYPPDYVDAFSSCIRRLSGRAIVAAHGRTYLGRPRSVHHVSGVVGYFGGAIRQGRLINHAGTGVMAWDASKLKLPTTYSQRNLADMQLAVWAQRNGVPMWLLPHEAHWLKALAPHDPQGIFKASQLERHSRRDAMIRQQGSLNHWQLFDI